MLQARLKAAGFYVGPIDGIVGPKTKSALFRLQAACANLKDLLETSARVLNSKLDNATNSSPKSEETRLIGKTTERYRFRSGPIDGFGRQNESGGVFTFRSGCTMLNNLPPTLDKELQIADRRKSCAWRRKSYPVAAKMMGIESDKMTLSSEKIRQEQLRLRDAGFDPGPIDGILGPKTKVAMQRYQKSFALKIHNS